MNWIVEKYTKTSVERPRIENKSNSLNNVLVVPRVIDVLDSTDVESIVPVPTVPDVAEPAIKQTQE